MCVEVCEHDDKTYLRYDPQIKWRESYYFEMVMGLPPHQHPEGKVVLMKPLPAKDRSEPFPTWIVG